MFCRYCGSEIKDGSKFCAECGKQVNADLVSLSGEAKTFGTLRIKRSAQGSGALSAVDVFVDGEFACAVKLNSQMDVVRESGPHEVVLRMGKKDIGRISVNIIPNAISVCEFDPPLFGTEAKIKGTYYEGIEGAYSRSSAGGPSASCIRCPKCGGVMTTQAVSESRKSGCGTLLLYSILALTIFGLFIVIPLMLRQKNETVTYAVCSNCGYKQLLNK